MHSGDPVTRRCINCETLVSTQAFHKKDILTTFLVGESVLGWPKAHAALKQVLPMHDAVSSTRAVKAPTLMPSAPPHVVIHSCSASCSCALQFIGGSPATCCMACACCCIDNADCGYAGCTSRCRILQQGV